MYIRSILKLWSIQSIKYYLAQKEITYQAMKIYGGALNAYYGVKEANWKRLHPI